MTSDRPRASGQTSASIRSANLALVLKEIIAAPTPPSRATVASRLKMTRSTASRLVDELIVGKLVEEGMTQTGGVGRPGVQLHPARRTIIALGIEINADRTVFSAVDLAGEELMATLTEVDNVSPGSQLALANTASAARAFVEKLPKTATLIGVNLAFPGLVDRSAQLILRGPNLRWDGARPGDHFSRLFHEDTIPFSVGNDVEAAALSVLHELQAEGEPAPSFVFITGEVGVGGAIALEGDLLHGRHGWSSEIGHICVDPAGDLCGCGARGCLETIVGLRAVLKRIGATSRDDLHARLHDGDAVAQAELERVGKALGQALGAALNILDVSTILLGGYLASCLEWLLPALREELSTRVLWAGHSTIEIRAVSDSPRRAARGAAFAALDRVIHDPADWLDTRYATEPR